MLINRATGYRLVVLTSSNRQSAIGNRKSEIGTKGPTGYRLLVRVLT